MAVGCICPVLYVAYVNRYAVNSFDGDDWSVVRIVHEAIHGHVSFANLWSQYNESRLFVGSVIELAIGYASRLNLRSIVLFSAALFVAAYGIFLALVRRYLRRPLTPFPALIVGLIWFSLADVQNSLWAFQISWYLTVLFSTFVLFALLVPDQRHGLWLGLAVIGAIAASFSTVQGFLTWPLGLTVLLWSHLPLPNRSAGREGARRANRDVAVWIAAMVCTLIAYLPGYTLGNNGCDPSSSCSAAVALHHPVAIIRFFFALIGNVVPAGSFYGTALLWYGGLARFEFVGVVIFAASIYIVIRSWRARLTTEPCPLPLLLICFGLAFDVTIALGRSGNGHGSPLPNRYVMPNLLLLLGIATYVVARLPQLLNRCKQWHWRDLVRLVASAAFAALLVTQVVDATGFGLMNASKNRSYLEYSSRVFVNLGRLSPSQEMCEARSELFFQPGAYSGGWNGFHQTLDDATVDHLGEFQVQPAAIFRALGPPTPPVNCVQ